MTSEYRPHGPGRNWPQGSTAAAGIAVEDMRLMVQSRTPDDLDARADMLAAAMGATAFQKGQGGMHALAHPIGALYDTHHGMTNAVLMPYVLQFNRSVIEARIARLAAYLGLANPGFDSFLDLVMRLREDSGVPHALSALGVDDQRSHLIAQMAVADPSASGNPRPLAEKDTAAIFSAALEGRLWTPRSRQRGKRAQSNACLDCAFHPLSAASG